MSNCSTTYASVDRELELLKISTPQLVALNRFFFWFPIAVSILAMILWVALKDKFELTRIRPTALLAMTCFGVVVNSFISHYTAAFEVVLSCGSMIFCLLAIVPLVAGSLNSRMIIFYLLSRFSEEKAHRASLQMSNTGFVFDINEDSVDPIRSVVGNLHAVVVLALRILTFQAPIAIGDKDEDRMETLRALKFVTSTWGVVSMALSLIVPALFIAVIILLANLDSLKCNGCLQARQVSLYSMIAVGSWTVVIGIIMWLRVRKLPDPWGLRAECFNGLIWALLALLIFIVGVFLPTEQLIAMSYPFNYPVTVCILAMVIVNSFVQLGMAYYQDRTTQQIRQVRSMSNGSSHSLDEILVNPIKAEAFEQHLVRELGIESLLFIRDAGNWKAKYYDIAPSARKARAKKMFATYIAANGMYAVNIPDSMSRSIVKVLAAVEDDVPETLFDDAVKEIKTLLNVGAVARFVKSDSYKAVSLDKRRTLAPAPTTDMT